jgi:radical SAM superfamily enzyme YgiQ (UPF0313 family)
MEKMKVLLINPPWPGKGYGTRSQNRIIKHRPDKFIQFPLLMAYCCSNLKAHGHKVFWIDSVMDELSMGETFRRIKAINPEVLLMETTTPSIEHDFRFLSRVKKEFPKILIITAGQHVSGVPAESLKECSAIDIIVKGEFDPRVPLVLDNLDSLKNIEGIAFRKGKKIVDNQPQKGVFCKDLDTLPFPDRETIPFNKYGESWYNLKPFTNIQTTRGCPNYCTYCLSPNIMEGPFWRKRSISNVIEEIKILVNKYGVREINIDDPTFNYDKERVIRFCNELKRNKLKILWTVNARVDHIDREMLIHMRKAGCKMIRYGVESALPDMLKRMNKNITIEQVRRAVNLTKRAGILALCGFMFGFPYETKKSVEANIQLAKELKPDLIQCSIVLPYPGTKLYDEAKANKQLCFEKWSDFDMTKGPVVRMKGLGSKDLNGILSRMYREFYFRPSFAVQTIFGVRRISDISRIARTFISLVRTTLFFKAKN